MPCLPESDGKRGGRRLGSPAEMPDGIQQVG